MLHICRYMRHIFCQIPHIFPHTLPQKVLHILRKISAINQHPYYDRQGKTGLSVTGLLWVWF